MSISIERVRRLYDERAKYGPFATLAPHDIKEGKSRYVAAVFDAALLPHPKGLNANSRLLDYGCGTGILPWQISPAAGIAAGVDISSSMLVAARDKSHQDNNAPHYLQMDGVKLPVASGKFDCVVARQSLCHVADEEIDIVLKERARSMSAGGQFFLLDQVSESPTWRTLSDIYLAVKRSIAEIMERFSTAGFAPEKASPVRQPRFPWIYLAQLRTVPRVLVPTLAGLEVWWNRYFCSLRTMRWQNVLFIFRKT